MKPYIQPFERRLALQELRTMGAAEPRHLGLLEETSTEFELFSKVSSAELASRLAYWETVETKEQSIVTTQSLRESTMNAIRNGVAFDELRRLLPFNGQVPLPNRRCLRYGPHGIHEYRGKFFPQLVRSLINVANVGEASVVADPMSGSGTTIVEALLSGCHALGMDMNPLSVFVANVKCRLLTAKPSTLIAAYERVQVNLDARARRETKELAYFQRLPKADQDYLEGWFAQDVLIQLDQISRVIAGMTDADACDLMRASLSNILRRVSWQKEDDLRVRKEARPGTEIDAKREFLEELERSVRVVTAFLYQSGTLSKRAFDVFEGDARKCADAWGEASVDLIITSPPYATALPYLDTDRLSLSYLGLLPKSAHRLRDQQMIGNREVTERLRRSYWQKFEQEGSKLPQSINALIRRIHILNEKAGVGFRRRNLPSLLAKYFFDMKQVIGEMFRVLKPRSFAFMVVGNNHTVAGGHRVEIQTASLLRDIARQVGFHVAESLPMEMLLSRDIFKKNATASEEILAFYKRG